MCGFTGFLTTNEFPTNAGNLLRKMGEAISNRGPDDCGEWMDSNEKIGLSHRRLAIVDLSSAGHQPMVSSSDRFVIAFNGEIYNHMDLRQKLTDRCGQLPWRGHSDTETLLAGFEEWGIQTTLELSVGMFAFAVWDRSTRTLTLGRDRLGEKPLYYGWQRGCFLFGSELKALKIHPSFSANINRGAISLLLRHNYIPAPHSIFEGIHKLGPGCLLSISQSQPEPQITHYWSASQKINSGKNDPFQGSAEQAVAQLETLASDAIRKQMMADVSLGAFLSGGVDSTTVVALMQAQSSKPVKTFTIGFNEKGYNEAEHAKAVAKHIGTEHTEIYVTSQQAMAVIPKLPYLYDEPFSDSSQIPTYLVSQLAKEHVTVSLSGDAGDELFCGYNRYLMTSKLWGKISATPSPFRKIAANCISSVRAEKIDQVVHFLSAGRIKSPVGDKLHKGANLLNSTSAQDLYLGMVSHHRDPSALVIDGVEPSTVLTSHASTFSALTDVERMMALDLMSYLPDDILCKVDRAAMGVSLETRVPFLDHNIVEFAWTLPLSIKMKDGITKWPLRQVLYNHVPQELMDRPKMGFGIPLKEWLRGPLKDWGDSLLNYSRLQKEGFFHPEPIRILWEEHTSGKRNWTYLLWSILMFQAWLEAQ